MELRAGTPARNMRSGRIEREMTIDDLLKRKEDLKAIRKTRYAEYLAAGRSIRICEAIIKEWERRASSEAIAKPN